MTTPLSTKLPPISVLPTDSLGHVSLPWYRWFQTLQGTNSTTGVTAGTYGDAAHVAQFTVGTDGRLGFAQNVPIAGAGGGTVTSVGLQSVTGTLFITGSPVTSSGLIEADVVSAPIWTTARNLSFTGDATGTGLVDGSADVATALTLATVNANVGTWGDGTHVSQVTLNAKGLATAAASVAIPNFTSTTPGFAPLSGGGTANYLRADGTWAAPPGSGGTVTHTAGSLTSGQLIVGNGSADIKVGDLSGDVSTSGSGVTTIGALKVATGMIQASAVTEGKIGLSNVATNDVTTTQHGFAPKAPNDATKFLDGTGAYSVPAGSGVTAPFFPPQGRLTLVTGVPVLISDQTAKGTIYWTPFIGAQAPVYNGSSWTILAAASDVIYTLAAGAHLSGSLYDLFLYNNSGSLALGTSPAWTNSTTRSNAISMQSGIWTNTSSIVLTVSGGGSTTTIAAHQATYVGSFYATANGQTGMQFNPAAAAGGPNAFMALYNAYNRVRSICIAMDSTASWNYAVASARPANNSTSNRVTFLDGLGQSPVDGAYSAVVTMFGSAISVTGVAFDATAVLAGKLGRSQGSSNFSGDTIALNSSPPLLGLHYAQAVELAAGGTVTYLAGGQYMGLTISLDM